ncbi:hypothetical protein ACIBHX_26380 [Nonomuraea sp. NPDC050536]|uniref:hypothetical protein n=1 Tax=Nonomuraea sp. NPDC050536 TaxID=3364366 RepID=UPI0037CA7971
MDLLERACELKPELVHYATSGRFARELSVVLDRFYADGAAPDEAAAFLPVDFFVHQHRLPGGDTVIDRFLDDHPGLDDVSRDLLLSWKDVVEGVFEVRGHDHDTATLHNLVDELTYQARSNLGAGAFEPLSPGMFVVGRLIPLGEEWLISGTPAVHPADARQTLVSVAAHVALANPAYVFRNPEALATARRLQSEQRRCFVAYFGTDQVVCPGSEVEERMRGYLAYQSDRIPSAGTQPVFEVPGHVRSSDTVALIFDETHGFAYYRDFGRLEEIFADPRLLDRRPYRDLLSGYLRGDEVSPVPLVRLAERDPARADAVFAKLLGRSGFRWDRSGEALLRTHKPAHYTAPHLPNLTPTTQAITDHLTLPTT